ncbi:MAG: hypothetical protein Q4G16_05030 [Cruoricaptor ignavus]|nr:hypothetical protein [Cruoricaptor ignavus]
MNKLLLIFIVLFYAQLTHAQFLVITGTDGYANIREYNMTQSGKTLKNNTVVFWMDEYDGPGYSDDWLKIYYSEDAFYKNADETLEKMEIGLVHLSQVTPLEELQKASEKEISVKYDTQKFNFKDKKIVWGEDKTYIKKVNGKPLFGADCGLPKTEITKATAIINNQTIAIPKNLLWNILGATNGFRYYKNGNTYFAIQSNGDGACVYHVVWVFENGKLTQRLIGNIY